MDDVQFETLASLLEREGALPADRALPLLREATRSLAEAHAAGILHCDLRPDTLLVASDGRVLLAESALARRPGETRPPDTPGTERFVSPLYYPPEAAHVRPLDQRTDLFLLGGAFYHAMAGQPPFDGPDPEATALQYIRHDAPSLDQKVPGTPVLLNVLMQKLLRRNPDERYQSAEELLGAVERVERMCQKRQPARRPSSAAAGVPAPAAAEPVPESRPKTGRVKPGTSKREPRSERHPTTRRAGTAPKPLWQSKPFVYGAAAGGALLVIILLLLFSAGGKRPVVATRPPEKVEMPIVGPPPKTPVAPPEKDTKVKADVPKPKTSTPPVEPPEPPKKRWQAVKGTTAGTETMEEFRKRTEGLNIVDFEDYVVKWEYAGPYRDPDCGEKCGPFDKEFPPEKQGETPTWAPLPTGTDVGRPWLFDFRKMTEIAQVAAERAAIYLRTRVHSPLDRDVQIWAGSDDSIKIWLNGQVVHSNRRDRAVKPDEDKKDVTLKKGWNDLMVKIGQGSGEWGFCLRFRTRLGDEVTDLKADPAGK